MELSDALLPASWRVAGGLLYAALALVVLRRMPWYWLGRRDVPARFAAFTVAVLALWQLRAALGDAPAMHLLGATLLTLAFGPALATFALSLVLAGATYKAAQGWGCFGLNGLLLVMLPVGVSYAWARVTERLLPRHVFVYFFVAAFFGAAVSAAVSALAVGAVLALGGAVSRVALVGNYLPTSLLMLFPEAFLTGGFVTLAVAYKPHWLVSFRDRDYLEER
ncbi:MAG: energy-coupling factor ABC transporter permease [Gammaproteobacteria bacterium]|nr:energy-coupling factor ABC transporter permease [Gammaproteobacteria bacterium]